MTMRWIDYPFIIFILIIPLSSSLMQPPPWLKDFSTDLLQLFNNHSFYHIIKEDITRNVLSEEFIVQRDAPTAENEINKVYRSIKITLDKRIDSLKRLVEAGEKSIKEYVEPREDEIYSSNETCLYEDKIGAYHVYNDASIKEQSGVHINIESHTCDRNVVNDFTWTNQSYIEKTMKENYRSHSIFNQYIGTYSGVTRLYPRRKWLIEPKEITVDLFDPKFRPWFVNTEAPPKDIVFLVDYSGSTKGPTMHLTRITLLYILSTLSPNDYISAVWFSHSFHSLLSCNHTSFIPATTRNKKIFYEKLMELEEKDQAVLGPPLNHSIEILRDATQNVLFGDSRSGSHKLIILMTDGIDEWPTSVIQEALVNSNGEKVRVYGLAMGFGTGHLPLLDLLACQTSATSAIVDSISDVKSQSRSYLDHLSRIHASNLYDISIEKRPISWSRLYMDTQGLGPVFTLSSPIVHKKKNDDIDDIDQFSMGGVAAIDVHIKEITQHLPHRDDIKSFIVDNNGIVLYHKDHILPETEVHSIRRSACYDPSHHKQRVGGSRVQYGHSDERVYRLVGLIDSIPTIDLYEVEGNSTLVQRLRKAIIMEKCDGKRIKEPHIDGSYICKAIEGTPYTIVFYQSDKQDNYIYTGKENTVSIPYNPMVGYFLNKRSACNWKIDGYKRLSRFHQWIQDNECLSTDNESDRFSLAITRSLYNWTNQWNVQSENTTCNEIKYPGPFNPDYYINSFVSTRGQVTAFYPNCTYPIMKELIIKMEKERLWKDKNDDLQFSVRNDVLIVYKPILDKHGNRLAVVGTQWRLSYVSKLFSQYANNKIEKDDPCNDKHCLLVSRSGYVVAAHMNGDVLPSPSLLPIFDPSLSSYLLKNKHMHIEKSIDYQAECLAPLTTIWSTSPSSRLNNPIRSIIYSITTLLTTLLSFDISIIITPFLPQSTNAQPFWHNGVCKFQKIIPYERCAMENHHFTITYDGERQFDIDNSGCRRYGRMHQINSTKLVLVIVQKPCYRKYQEDLQYASMQLQYQPRRLRGCEIISNHPRRRPKYKYKTESKYEDLDQDCTSSSSSFINTNHFIICISAIIHSLYS